MSWRDPKFKYIPARDMTPSYLADKFRRMQNRQKAADKEAAEKVEALPVRKVRRA